MRSWNLEETFALIKDLLAGEARFLHAAVPRSCWLSRLIPACLLKLMKLGAGITNETDSLSHVGLRRQINTGPNNIKRSPEKDWQRCCLFPSVCMCVRLKCVPRLTFAPRHLRVTSRCCGDRFRPPPVDCFNISPVGHKPVLVRLQARFQWSRTFK